MEVKKLFYFYKERIEIENCFCFSFELFVSFLMNKACKTLFYILIISTQRWVIARVVT